MSDSPSSKGQYQFDPNLPRCSWVNLDNPLYVDYHDNEWGQPVYEDTHLFELVTLEGAQAGLSWETVLNRRAGYRTLFNQFNIDSVAAFDESDVERIVQDKRVIRHRGKIESTISNARAVQQIQQEYRSFSDYLWAYVDNTPQKHHYQKLSEIPAQTDLSKQISKDLKKRGFRFVGPTIIYAFMQAAGMVDDHVTGCFCFGDG